MTTYLRSLWHWAAAHPEAVFLLLSAGAFLGLVLGGILAGASEPVRPVGAGPRSPADVSDGTPHF